MLYDTNVKQISSNRDYNLFYCTALEPGGRVGACWSRVLISHYYSIELLHSSRNSCAGIAFQKDGQKTICCMFVMFLIVVLVFLQFSFLCGTQCEN